jgi:hypothetical protein
MFSWLGLVKLRLIFGDPPEGLLPDGRDSVLPGGFREPVEDPSAAKEGRVVFRREGTRRTAPIPGEPGACSEGESERFEDEDWRCGVRGEERVGEVPGGVFLEGEVDITGCCIFIVVTVDPMLAGVEPIIMGPIRGII